MGTLANLVRAVYAISPLQRGLNRLSQEIYFKHYRDRKSPVRRYAALGKSRFKAELDLTDRIQFMMYVRGYHERDHEELVLSQFPKGGCFVDAGANIGYYSLLVAKNDPDAEIYAIEPSPKNCATLLSNSILNGFIHIHAHEKALSFEDGTAWLTCDDPERESGWNRITSAPTEERGEEKGGEKDGEKGNGRRVDILRLDELLRRAGGPRVDFIKIDVEGHEVPLLKGATQTLSAPGRRGVLIEFNRANLSRAGHHADEIHDLLSALGYDAYRILRGGKIRRVDYPKAEWPDQDYFYLKEPS